MQNSISEEHNIDITGKSIFHLLGWNSVAQHGSCTDGITLSSPAKQFNLKGRTTVLTSTKAVQLNISSQSWIGLKNCRYTYTGVGLNHNLF